MGKQIQIATDFNDEINFIKYLQQEAKISLITSHTKNKKDLIIDDINELNSLKYTYYIWNKTFEWIPEYAQVVSTSPFKEMIGLYYIKNTNDAPLIQFVRSNLDKRDFGRIYWAKYFAAPNGLKYDVNLFEEWYKKVSKYFIKNCIYKEKYININTYIMPEAYKYLKNRNMI